MNDTTASPKERVLEWLDHRTGIRDFIHAALYEHIPGGARWRYVWGSTLVFTFAIQMVTGFFLWAAYSPSSTTAWESVYYIQNELVGGWLLRGVHHYTAQIMVVLIALHMMQVIVDGAYRAPREFNFWIGLVLLQIVLGLGLTGYLLPWDQKGYWATKVATNISGLTPIVGDQVKQIAVGGSEYGHHTLTRFFALHAGLLPFLMIAFVVVHIVLFRRHGIHEHKRQATRPDASFWPDQVLKDSVACLGVLLVVVFLVFQGRLFGGAETPLGASLMAPADPSQPYDAARPDWYFLFLYEFLKLPYFKGENEVIGAIYIPGAVMGLMSMMPYLGRWKLGHAFNVVFFFALLGGAGFLTAEALRHDAEDQDYQLAVEQANTDARRMPELAQHPDGIPPSGALTLLRNDPKTQGPKLFKRYCAACHSYEGNDGVGGALDEAPTASDLKGFASREWLTGFFDPEQIATSHYFGGTELKDGKMVRFVKKTAKNEELAPLVPKVVKALSARALLKSQRGLDASDQDEIAEGSALIEGDDFGCLDCHEDGAPNLDAYGSFLWMVDFISDPAHERFYGKKNDRMPSFGEKEILDRQKIELLVHWLRGEWFVPGEGEAVPPTGDSATAPEDATPQEPKAEEPEESEEPEKSKETEESEEADETEEPADTEEPEKPGEHEKPEPQEQPEKAATPAQEVPAVAANIKFAEHIQPILETHCLKCHGGGGKKPKARFSLVSREKAFGVGRSDETGITPNDRAASLVFELISSDDDEERMPPEDETPLSATQIETIGRWIDAGAKWPDGVELDVAK